MLTHSVTTLANGLRIVTVPAPHLHSLGICLAIGCGSRHDPAGLPGLGHLLEHMLFRGGARLRSLLAVARAIERAGGTLEAGTWRDQMEVTAQVAPGGLAPALATIADIVGHPCLRDLEEERGVVAEELRGELDADGGDACPTNRSRRAVWAGHPLGHSILGTSASLARASDAALRAHHRRHFVAGNMVLCVAGPVRPSQVRRAAGALATLPAGERPPAGPPPPPWRGGIELACQPAAQVGLQLTFAAPADVGEALVPARVAACLLDDGPTTRLQEALVNRRGWAYDLASGLDCYADAGLFDIELQLEPARVVAAAEVALATVGALGREGPRPGELAAARKRLALAATWELDDVAAIAGRYAALALAGQPLDWRRELDALASVGAGQVRAAARAIFLDGPLRLTAIGPLPAAVRRSLASLAQAGLRAA